MKKSFILYCIVFILLITSCNNIDDATVSSEPNPFEKNDNIKYGYYFGYSRPPNEYYDGKEISFDYMIENYDIKENLGIMIFLNGILQKYKVDNNEYLMYQFDIQAKEKKILSVSFIPSIGNKGDVLDLFVILINKPSFVGKPYSAKITDKYAQKHNLSTTLPKKINFLKSSNNSYQKSLTDNVISTPLNEKIVEDYINCYGKDYDTTKIIPTADFFDIEKNIYENEVIKTNIKLDSNFAIYSGAITKYRVTFFVDSKPVLINEEYYTLDIDIIKDQMSWRNISFDLEKGNHSIYAICVPLNADLEYTDIIKTSSKTVIVE